MDAEDEKRVEDGHWGRCLWYYFRVDEQDRWKLKNDMAEVRNERSVA